MDAVRFLKEKLRMCDKYSCKNCPLSIANNGTGEGCDYLVRNNPDKCVEIVEAWSVEHPVKTRQSEFLKMFPNAKLIDNEIIFMCPKFIDETYKDDKDCLARKCYVCKKEYWLEEVE